MKKNNRLRALSDILNNGLFKSADPTVPIEERANYTDPDTSEQRFLVDQLKLVIEDHFTPSYPHIKYDAIHKKMVNDIIDIFLSPVWGVEMGDGTIKYPEYDVDKDVREYYFNKLSTWISMLKSDNDWGNPNKVERQWVTDKIWDAITDDYSPFSDEIDSEIKEGNHHLKIRAVLYRAEQEAVARTFKKAEDKYNKLSPLEKKDYMQRVAGEFFGTPQLYSYQLKEQNAEREAFLCESKFMQLRGRWEWISQNYNIEMQGDSKSSNWIPESRKTPGKRMDYDEWMANNYVTYKLNDCKRFPHGRREMEAHGRYYSSISREDLPNLTWEEWATGKGSSGAGPLGNHTPLPDHLNQTSFKYSEEPRKYISRETTPDK